MISKTSAKTKAKVLIDHRATQTGPQKKESARELAADAVRFAYERYMQWQALAMAEAQKTEPDELALQADQETFADWVKDVLTP